MGETTWASLRAEAIERLHRAGVASPDADARWLVEEAAPAIDGPVTERSIAHFDRMLARREAGEPLQYVLGRWGFRTLDLLVDRRVLVPRPETEILAGVAIDEARALTGSDPQVTVVDLGTGSGAIGLAVAVEVVTATVWLTDRSTDALAVAGANLAGIGRPGRRVRLSEGDWFGAVPHELLGRIDVVVSNPPYVAVGDHLPPEVADWEPREALLAGADGLDHLRRIVAEAGRWLARPGSLVLECAPDQTTRVGALARDAGFERVDVLRDLTGRERVVRCRMTAESPRQLD